MAKKILVLGSSFAGLTASLSLKRELRDDVDVTVISPSDVFVFNPSLIWLPFGKRTADDVTFPVTPTLDHHRIDFVHHAATLIDPVAQTVTAGGTIYQYDYLVIATGFRNDFDVAPGLGPDGNAVTITSLDDAILAGEAWDKLWYVGRTFTYPRGSARPLSVMTCWPMNGGITIAKFMGKSVPSLSRIVSVST